MHDNLWNSFVTLLSALSPAHLCAEQHSPHRASLVTSLSRSLTHSQPGLFSCKNFSSLRGCPAFRQDRAVVKGPHQRPFANLKLNWSFLQRGVWRSLARGPAIPELQTHTEHRTHPSEAGCTAVPSSGDFFEEWNGNDPLMALISLPFKIKLKFCCGQWFILTWAKDLTLNTTGPPVWHLLSCCTGGRCWAANIPFYSMKYGNKLRNQYFISNNLVINAKVHYPRASPLLCCTTFHWKARKPYKEINEIKETKKQNLLTWKRNSGCTFRTNWMLLPQWLKVDLKPWLSIKVKAPLLTLRHCTFLGSYSLGVFVNTCPSLPG